MSYTIDNTLTSLQGPQIYYFVPSHLPMAHMNPIANTQALLILDPVLNEPVLGV